MSLSSEVVLILNQGAAQALDEFAARNGNAAKMLGLCSKRKKDEASGDELLLWNNLRWYDGDLEIRCLRGFLLTLDEEAYLFMRLGNCGPYDAEAKGKKDSGPFSVRIRRQLCVEENGSPVYTCEK